MALHTPPESQRTVAVIGAGFSGLLTAIHLLDADPALTVRLVERARHFGRGRAYQAPDPDHMLNVRTANMSAFPDRPSHFDDWLRRGDDYAGPHAFVSRGRYGDYLQDLLREAVSDPTRPGRLLLEQDEAVAVQPAGGGFRVSLALGRNFQADAVVLAVGAGPPARPPGVSADVLSYRTFVGDPWRGDLDNLPDGEILLLGTGLTMLDVALSLDRQGRSLLAISRHGLLPRPHAVAPASDPPDGPMDTPLRALRTLRAHAEGRDWRSAVDSVRGLTPDIWRGWSERERRRFLRHLQPWWDAHRHRVSPTAVGRLSQAMWGERLAVMAGRLESLEPADAGFRARIRLRGRRGGVIRYFQGVVNCTGLSGDLRATRLLADLRERGLARPDRLRLGLDVRDGRLVAADGHVQRGLYAVGPLTRADHWEAIAVPDLRVQTAEIAATVVRDLAAFA